MDQGLLFFLHFKVSLFNDLSTVINFAIFYFTVLSSKFMTLNTVKSFLKPNTQEHIFEISTMNITGKRLKTRI